MAFKSKERIAKAAMAKTNVTTFFIEGDYEADRQKFSAMSQDLGITFDGNNNVVDNDIKDDVTANTADSHTHSNKSVLDNTTASYTTTDETKIDYLSITQEVNLDTIETDSHTHSNKSVLDTYNQTNANITSAITDSHIHSNKSVLDSTTASYTTSEESKLDGLENYSDTLIQAKITSLATLFGITFDGSGNITAEDYTSHTHTETGTETEGVS